MRPTKPIALHGRILRRTIAGLRRPILRQTRKRAAASDLAWITAAVLQGPSSVPNRSLALRHAVEIAHGGTYQLGHSADVIRLGSSASFPLGKRFYTLGRRSH